MEEVWKDIDGYDGKYKVSSFGKVKSLKNNKEKVLSVHLWGAGYLVVNLWKNNKNTSTNVHVLIATYFIENTTNLPCVNHKNGIKTDNRIENLEWCTYSENAKHAYKTGLKVSIKGEAQNKSKLKNNDVLDIRNLCANGIQNIDVAKKYKICPSVVSRIKNRRYWNHI